MARVRIRYTDGTETTGPPEDWTGLRADGVDWVEIHCGELGYRLQGYSLYWLRRVDGEWRAGGVGAVQRTRGYGDPPLEVTVAEGFPVAELAYMPDLAHREIKLGHWLPGTGP